MQSITIPDSVTHIGYGAFFDTKIIFNQNNFKICLFLDGSWGSSGDEKNLARFYNDPTHDNFNKVNETCYKNPMALLRFFGYHEDEYRNYIRRNIVEIASGLIDEKNSGLMNMILAAGFINKNNTDELINYAVEKKQTEITALLLEYKSKHFGFTDINKRFRL